MKDWYQQDQFRPFSLVHDAGERDRPAALLVHGFTGTPAEMRPLGNTLFNLKCDAHGMLVRGMGPEIEDLNRMTAREWRDASLARWREHAGHYRRTILIGYSLGAAIALIQAAGRPPDLLILLAPHVRLADRRGILLPIAKHVVKELNQFKDIDFANPDTRLWFTRTLPGLDLDDTEVQDSIRNDTPMSMKMLDEMRRLSRSGERAAPRVSAPTVVVQGTRDTIALPQHSARLVKKLSNLIAYHTIDADHMLPFESFPSWALVRELVERAVAETFPESRREDTP